MNRRHTDPGVAPPAPGSVLPPVPSPYVARPPVLGRKLTPGAGAYSSEDETPTRPDGNVDPDMLKLVRLVGDMPQVERRRFVRMVEGYTKCALGRRVLIEELARELAAVKEKT